MLLLSGLISQRVAVLEGKVHYMGMGIVGSKKIRVGGEPVGIVVICSLNVLCGMFEPQVSYTVLFRRCVDGQNIVSRKAK